MRGLSLLLLAVLGTARADDGVPISVFGTDVDLENVPVSLVGKKATEPADVTLTGGGQTLLGQMTSDGGLHFVVPRLKAKQELQLKLRPGVETDKPLVRYLWKETPGQFAELTRGGLPVLRYECATLDESSKAARDRTFKVFHHLFDRKGHRVTNGPGGQFPHHRGLFFGFNKVSYGGKNADVWHCTGDAFQGHEETLASEAGLVLGRQRVKIGWHGPKKELFATEERTLTAYHLPGGTLVEFASKVTPRVSVLVKLDGDPQHAGFHFRADNAVSVAADAAKKAKQPADTYYLRPDGKGKPGETRNWEPKTKQGPVNLPWNAMSFVLDGRRYTAVYLDHPDNPKEARTSERDYGRFGSYFEYTLTADKPLNVRYRLWLQEGEMTVEQCVGLSAAFVHPPRVDTLAVR